MSDLSDPAREALGTAGPIGAGWAPIVERCTAAPPSWQIGRYRFERNPQPVKRWRRWGCSDGAYGVGNCVTPVAAFLAQRR